MSRILIIEDEGRLASFLEKGLAANGYATTVASDGASGLALARGSDFELVLLDLGLPDLDGLSVLDELRQRDEQLPVLVLTARDEVGDTVLGLDRGADDYLTKPFRFEELLARIRARLRDPGRVEQTMLEAGKVTLDLRARRASAGGDPIELTAREFALLETFMRHPDQVLSREQLLSHVWGYDYDPGSNVVEVYIGYLRRKLGEGSIQTVRGMGYALRAG